MADYKKMYILLCAAIDEVLDRLLESEETLEIGEKLRDALLQAEEIYMETD